MARTYQTEFPDFPAADMPPIPADWADESWHNEPCPRFYSQSGLSVFVDYADPAAREFPDCQRFTVRADYDGENAADVRDLLESDDWADVLAYIAAFERCEHVRRFNLTDSPLPESTYEAFREGRATRAQYVAIKAENDAAGRPCPDLAAHLATVFGKGR